MVAKTLEVTPQAARRIVLELGLKGDDGQGEVSGVGDNLRSMCPVLCRNVRQISINNEMGKLLTS